MAQKEKQHNIVSVLGDISMTVLAVGIAGLIFVGVSGLTPRIGQKISENSPSILGVSTKQQALSFFPESVKNLPFVTELVLSGSTTLNGGIKAKIVFAPLQASTYELPLLTIKNNSLEYKKVSMNPNFSLENSYTSISLTFAGQTTEIIDVQGGVTPLDLVVPPNSSSSISLTMKPSTRLATPVTLTIDFTEHP